jgi:hypothetical protein
MMILGVMIVLVSPPATKRATPTKAWGLIPTERFSVETRTAVYIDGDLVANKFGQRMNNVAVEIEES